jgi:hypothetical protein
LTLAFAIGLLLSIASFYTTWDGLVEFTAPEAGSRSWGSQALALFVAAGIQSVMLLASWTVGMALVRGSDPHRDFRARARDLRGAALWSLMFLATFAFSVFFSYHAFYIRIVDYVATTGVARAGVSEGISDAQARGNRSPHINSLAETHVRSIVAANLTEMRNAAEVQRYTYFEALTRPARGLSKGAQTALKENPSLGRGADAWNTYVARMKEIVAFGRDNVALVGATAEQRLSADNKRRQEIAADNEQRRKAIEKSTADLEHAKSEIKATSTAIADQKSAIQELTRQIEGYEQRARVARNRMECERYGTECLNIQRRAPRGMRREYHRAAADLRAVETPKRQLEDQLAEQNNRLRMSEQKLATSEAERTAAEKRLATESSVAPRTADGITSLLTATQFKELLDKMDGALTHLDNPAAFGDPNSLPETSASPVAPVAALAELESKCEAIKLYLSNELFGAVASDARKFVCAQDGFTDATARLQQLNAGLRAFDKAGCQNLGRKFRGENTRNIIDRGEVCLDLVALDGERFDHFMRSFGDLRREHNESVHPFVQSWNGLASYNDKLAYLSLGIASMVDLLVFFVGIAGGKESLRRIDRIGGELRGSEVLGLALAAAKSERTTDSEPVRVARLILTRLIPQDYVPNPQDAPHIRYSGYIFEKDLQRGVADDDLVRRQIQMWMSTPKSGVDLVIRIPRPEQASPQPDSGVMEPEPEFEEEPSRFFFLRELVIDLAETIVHWDKAHASGPDSVAAAAPPVGQRRRQPDRNAAQAAPPKPSFWSWGRSSRRHSAAGGTDARPRGSDSEFQIVRSDGSVATAHSPGENGGRPTTSGASGQASPTNEAESQSATENADRHRLRSGG